MNSPTALAKARLPTSCVSLPGSVNTPTPQWAVDATTNTPAAATYAHRPGSSMNACGIRP